MLSDKVLHWQIGAGFLVDELSVAVLSWLVFTSREQTRIKKKKRGIFLRLVTEQHAFRDFRKCKSIIKVYVVKASTKFSSTIVKIERLLNDCNNIFRYVHPQP